MTDLTNTITETRTGVTEVKAFIDGMRTSRDTKMADLNALKNQLKEQNQRLMQVFHGVLGEGARRSLKWLVAHNIIL